MATTARSSSPGPARSPTPCCAAMRRSADSTPFKPACKASLLVDGSALQDCTQRRFKNGGSCGCHTSPRTSFGEKENDERNAAGATPKVRGSGGAKNFMAPTISAASKAVAASASPRKKVLGERNEHHHLAPSPPADLAHKPKGPPDADLAHRPKGPTEGGSCARLRLSFDRGAPATPAAVPDSSHGSRHSSGGDDARMENSEYKCKVHLHAMAHPVDAEPPHAAPYDPKTNYLSPRPRFLRYTPNPRIEMYRHGGSGVRQLDDGFASESSEETDITTRQEDELTEDEQEQAQQKPKPNDLPEEPSAQAAPSEACLQPPAVVLTSEPAARVLTPMHRVISPRARAQTPESEPELGASSLRVPANLRSRRRFLLAAPLALLLFMAAAFVHVPPRPYSPLMSKVSDFLSVQELHPVELAAWLEQWSSSSLDSITSYWEALASSKEQEIFGPQFAANLSAANVDADHGSDFYYNFAESPMLSEEPTGADVLEELIQNVSESLADLTAEPEAGDADHDADFFYNFAETWQMQSEEPIDDIFEFTQDAVSESNTDLTAAAPVEVVDADAADEYKVVEELDVQISEEFPGNNGEDMASFSQNLDIPSQPTTEPVQEEQDVETDQSMDDHANGKDDQEAYRGLKSGLTMWPAYMDKIPKPAAVGVALIAVILATGMAVLCGRRKQVQVAANADAPTEQAEQVVTHSVSGSSHLLMKASQFQTSMAEETEKFRDSGFSQYSSSLSSSHGRGRKVKEDESLSLEPVSKRESMTHSTSSYGSFTTYEKISAKKKNKEDEAMTPVRRSSRLRSVKSPEA